MRANSKRHTLKGPAGHHQLVEDADAEFVAQSGSSASQTAYAEDGAAQASGSTTNVTLNAAGLHLSLGARAGAGARFRVPWRRYLKMVDTRVIMHIMRVSPLGTKLMARKEIKLTRRGRSASKRDRSLSSSTRLAAFRMNLSSDAERGAAGGAAWPEDRAASSASMVAPGGRYVSYDDCGCGCT